MFESFRPRGPTGGGDCRARRRCNQGRLWVAKRVTQQGDYALRELKGSGEVNLEEKMINSIWATALKGK